jgi:hypothetical protein
LLVAGGTAALGAGVIFLQSVFREQAALNELALGRTQPQLQLKPASYYREEASGVARERLIGALVAGAGAALITTGLLVSPRDNAAVRVTLVPTVDGVTVVGTWP